jgi:hypothetical protein
VAIHQSVGILAPAETGLYTPAAVIGVTPTLISYPTAPPVGAVAHELDLTVLGDSILLFTQRVRVVELVARNQLPAVYNAREFVAAGGLMSYAVSYPDLFRRSAVYVDKIVKGAKPRYLPAPRVAPRRR